MAYDERLAERVRNILDSKRRVSERKMFGGIAFMLGGNMCCGVVRNELMVRVGPEQFHRLLARPGARPMDFTGRPMKGMLYIDAKTCANARSLASWVERGAAYAASLPQK